MRDADAAFKSKAASRRLIYAAPHQKLSDDTRRKIITPRKWLIDFLRGIAITFRYDAKIAESFDGSIVRDSSAISDSMFVVVAPLLLRIRFTSVSPSLRFNSWQRPPSVWGPGLRYCGGLRSSTDYYKIVDLYFFKWFLKKLNMFLRMSIFNCHLSAHCVSRRGAKVILLIVSFLNDQY